MKDAEIRRMYQWIQSRVTLAADAATTTILFDEPNRADFEQQSFGAEAVELTLESSWWQEMTTDIVETPDYAEAGEPPEQVLQYARDVVVEYVSKRLGT